MKFAALSLFTFALSGAVVASVSSATDSSSLEKRADPLPACKASKCTKQIPAHSHRICTKAHVCSFSCNDFFEDQNGVCVPTTTRHKACKAAACTNRLPDNSHAICSNGQCTFSCDDGYQPRGRQWIKNRTQCKHSSQCPTKHIKHSFPVCLYGKCGTDCSTGYTMQDATTCVPNAATCGANACQPISEGGVKCVNGTCEYSCRAGYTLETSGGGASCVELSTDPNNCGSVGHSCPADYSGLGTPICHNGKCSLDCPFGTRLTHNPNRCTT